MGWGVGDYPEPPEQKEYFCPECGEECNTLYILNGLIIGCDNCIESMDAQFYYEEVQV